MLNNPEENRENSISVSLQLQPKNGQNRLNELGWMDTFISDI